MEKMGGIVGRLTRPLKNFNVENRAQRVISKEKPIPAPRHPSTLKYMEELKKDAEKPSPKEENVHLDRLKQVYVTSTDPKVTTKADQPGADDRQMPLDRAFHEDPEFGYLEPAVVTAGKVTLRQAVDFINKHNTDPEQWTASKIAEEYKLDLRLAQAILTHFQPFLLRLPDKTKLDKDWKKSWAKQLPILGNAKLITEK